MKYYHRTSVSPDAVIARATALFGARLAPTETGLRALSFKGSLGSIRVDVAAEGGHYTLVTILTDQPAESELDRLGKRFLGEVHKMANPQHELRGTY
ncbi:MAG: hypothetical protein ABIR59_12390 [Gemmatimonadales bacterium]